MTVFPARFADELAHVRGASGDDITAGAELLEALLRRPAWHARARCRGYGPGAFFEGETARAKATCRGCPVQDECAEAGNDEREGVWGGLTSRERRAMRRQAG